MNYINHFRPIYEFRPLLLWPVAMVGILCSGMPYGWAFALAGACACWWFEAFRCGGR